jgi:hypothetical protein
MDDGVWEYLPHLQGMRLMERRPILENTIVPPTTSEKSVDATVTTVDQEVDEALLLTLTSQGRRIERSSWQWLAGFKSRWMTPELWINWRPCLRKNN